MILHDLRAHRTEDGSYSVRAPDGDEVGHVWKWHHRDALNERGRTRLRAVLPDGRSNDFTNLSLAINWIAAAP
jgi:hypothetical protein